MISAIGASRTAITATTAQSTAGLESQIEQYKKKLADCISCPSSKTPKGKENIQTLAAKVSTLMAQAEKIRNAKAASISPNSDPTNATANQVHAANNSSATNTASDGDTLGTRLNVFA